MATYIFIVAIVGSIGICAYMFSQKVKRFVEYHPVGGIVAGVWVFFITTNVALCPAIIFFLLHNAIGPVGFWENLVLSGLGLYFLGTLQLILIIAWVIFWIVVLMATKK
ncbi:MAG: hypothetical protein WCT26_02570 [Candidatus Buchananbacteria bacterium]|jgi:hypothetical protein